MTSIIGVYCKDGVVIGADSSATLGYGQIHTVEQEYKKIHIIENQLIVVGTGEIGLDQRFCYVVENYYKDDRSNDPAQKIAVDLSGLMINNMRQTALPTGHYGALFAFPAEDRHHLCRFDTAKFQPELKNKRLWYCSMGSAKYITDTFLAFIRNIFWKDGLPTIQDGIFAVTWTLSLAVDVNTGGVNEPIRIAVLERTKRSKLRSRILTKDELQEHQQNIRAVKQHLGEFPAKYREIDSEGALDLPKPPD